MDDFPVSLEGEGERGHIIERISRTRKFIGFPDYFPQSLYIFSDFEESVDRHTPGGEGKREVAPEKLYIILISSRSFSKPHPERRDEEESWGGMSPMATCRLNAFSSSPPNVDTMVAGWSPPVFI